MIEAAATHTGLNPTGRSQAADERETAPVGTGFSFALAAASLETKAAQSLETHGAAPSSSGSIVTNLNATNKADTAGTQPLQIVKTQADASSNVRTLQSENAAAPSAIQSPPQPPQPVASLPVNPTANPLVAVGAATLAAPAQAPSAPVRAESLAIRAGDLAKPDSLKAPRPTVPVAKAEMPAQDFAKLLARRLDSGATQFELRLDPPDLGKVEASLKVSEKGDNVLALKFEHQSTLDLFSRDDTALRTALSSSGFDLGGHNLSFSLTDLAASAEQSALNASDASFLYEPKFIAAWSSGAIDLSL